jgi:endonuclease/exonuclease/phosphatase family metal-dependent hydrolase
MPNRKLRTIVSYNCHVGRHPAEMTRELRNLIRDTRADVICLQEARGYINAIRLAFPRWKVYAKPGWPDSDHCPVMVRRSIPRGRVYGRGWGTVRIEQGWVYTGNGGATPKPGRTWTWVRVDGVHVLSLHRIPGKAGNNNLSYAEETHALREWFAEHGGPMVAIGDANESPKDVNAGTMLAISRKVGGRLIHDKDDPGIDYACARELRGHLERIGNYGSDHRAAVLTIKE